MCQNVEDRKITDQNDSIAATLIAFWIASICLDNYYNGTADLRLAAVGTNTPHSYKVSNGFTNYAFNIVFFET
eukprot:4379826-Amphidinium_carterae.1